MVVGKCVFCHHRVAGNADPVIPVRDTFLKPRGGSGRAPSKHPSISGFHHNTRKKEQQTSDCDSWQLDAGRLQLPAAFLGFVLISCRASRKVALQHL